MKATAIAGSNIAFIKYWGQLDAELRLPANGSLSMTLDAATTTTTVEFSRALAADALLLDGKPATAEATARVSQQLARIRRLAGVGMGARVASRNSFPTGAGIASSASGFAALTIAACAALGLPASTDELSRLARLASGSACRSIYGGFVEWAAGARHEDSYARQLAPEDYWDVVDVVAVVSRAPKGVPSEAGHALAGSSPFFAARLATLHGALARARAAILERDLSALGELAEADALSMHAVAMTSRPGIFYWEPATLAVMAAVRQWRAEGLAAYFTVDAGPNVHVLTARASLASVLARLAAMPVVGQTIVCGPGRAARLSDEHLFE